MTPEAAAPPLRLERLAGPDALLPLADAATALTERQPCPNPCTLVPYLYPLARLAGSRFAFRALWAGDALAGLLPLSCERRHRLGIPVPRLGFVDTAPPMCADWLVDPAVVPRLPEVLTLLERAGGWADAFFRLVPESSPLVTIPESERLHRQKTTGSLSTRLEPTWDDLWGRFSGNRRRHIRRILRMDKFGPGVQAIVTHFPEDSADVEGLVEDMRTVVQRGWKSAERGWEAHRDLMFEATRRMADAGRAHGFVLRLDERPAAFLLCFRAGAHLHAVWNAHDPAVEAGSPGAVLIATALRTGCERGWERVHFGNDRPYLRHWAVDEHAYYTVRLFNPGVRGQLLRSLGQRRSERPASSETAAPAEKPADGEN